MRTVVFNFAPKKLLETWQCRILENIFTNRNQIIQ